ncbi:MAG: hypothetical protein H0U79_01230 [Solirubrobacterales bacterium]|nr:hypothetical protein [Solirubrobacterales bacterium]
MSLEFLQVDQAVEHGGRRPLARSPMEGVARAAGARFEVREGWNVAVAYATPTGATTSTVGFTDTSHLGKVEVRADVEVLPRVLAAAGLGALSFGTALRRDDAWWCPVTPDRALALGDAPALRARLEQAAAGVEGYVSVVDITTTHAALTLTGPQARETFARFTALDLRPRSAPVGAFRPGSVARSPGFVLREGEERYVMLFGAALGEYVWEQVADAASHLGGAPVGVDSLPAIEAALEGVSAHA